MVYYNKINLIFEMKCAYLDTFVPDNYIICEECYKVFFSYARIACIIDADSYDSYSQSVKTGLINRIVCSACKSEFTFETPLLIYSLRHRIAVVAAFSEDPPYNSRLPFAFKAAGAGNINLRIAPYASSAAEKIRIVSNGLDDIKTELFKVNEFACYKDMDESDEYITFERTENNNLIFTHRDFKDIVLKEFSIPIKKYNDFNPVLPDVPAGKWFKADKEWAVNYMEAQK